MPIRVAVAITLLLLMAISPFNIANEHSPQEHTPAIDAKQAAPAEHPSAEHSPPKLNAAQHESSAHESSGHENPAQPAETTGLVEPQLQNLPSDVRVLIDISGSMKKTDPQNLRKPALDLMVRLLPDKSRAGVWLFGNDVDMLMPHNLVDPNWRKQAATKAEKINSIALHTNIGKALDAVGFDKANMNTHYKTHIVLLTDGVVDISKEAVDNTKERQRILTDVLPSLKRAGYTVHTIALSADADADLLRKISVGTDGIFITAQSADELTATFLKIFDQAVPAERLPLDDDGFLVDASVKEFTALIFRKPGVEKTVLLAPDGKEYSATSPVDGVNWYRTDKYDLITTLAPKAGQWKIKTEITPQSRITVISNLKLIMQPLKNNIHSDDSLELHYSFQENEKTVTNLDFLSLLETSVIIVKDGSKENVTLNLDMANSPADGIYHQKINSFSAVGDYDIHVYVDGKTFKREFKHSLSVRDSLLSVDKGNSTLKGGRRSYDYRITTDRALVDLSKTQLTAIVKSESKSLVKKDLSLVDDNHWKFSFAPEHSAEYDVSFHASGAMVGGDSYDETIHADTFSYEEKVVEEKPPEPTKVEVQKVAEKPEPTADSGSNTVMYIAIGLANLLVIGLGYAAYRMFFGGKASDEMAELEKTLNMDASKIKENSGDKKTSEKLNINLNEEKPADIPMSDNLGMDTLFPLDDMGEENK